MILWFSRGVERTGHAVRLAVLVAAVSGLVFCWLALGAVALSPAHPVYDWSSPEELAIEQAAAVRTVEPACLRTFDLDCIVDFAVRIAKERSDRLHRKFGFDFCRVLLDAGQNDRAVAVAGQLGYVEEIQSLIEANRSRAQALAEMEASMEAPQVPEPAAPEEHPQTLGTAISAYVQREDFAGALSALEALRDQPSRKAAVAAVVNDLENGEPSVAQIAFVRDLPATYFDWEWQRNSLVSVAAHRRVRAGDEGAAWRLYERCPSDHCKSAILGSISLAQAARGDIEPVIGVLDKVSWTHYLLASRLVILAMIDRGDTRTWEFISRFRKQTIGGPFDRGEQSEFTKAFLLKGDVAAALRVSREYNYGTSSLATLIDHAARRARS